MDSTLTLSPPTSWVNAARSVVDVTTLSFLASAAIGESRAPAIRPSASMTAKREKLLTLFIALLEGVRTVGPQCKLHLHEQLMNVKVSIASKLILSANLAELARPVGKDRGKTFVN